TLSIGMLRHAQPSDNTREGRTKIMSDRVRDMSDAFHQEFNLIQHCIDVPAQMCELILCFRWRDAVRQLARADFERSATYPADAILEFTPENIGAKQDQQQSQHNGGKY